MPVPPIASTAAEPAWPIPNLNLRVEDLSHPGATVFFEEAHPTTVLRDAVIASFTWLYTPETMPTKSAEPASFCFFPQSLSLDL